MSELVDILAPLVYAVAFILSTLLVLNYLQARHKLDLEYAKKAAIEENETSLNKARIYADKDVKIANMQQDVFGQVAGFAGENDEWSQYMPLINMAMQNPDILKNIIEKIQPQNKG